MIYPSCASWSSPLAIPDMSRFIASMPDLILSTFLLSGTRKKRAIDEGFTLILWITVSICAVFDNFFAVTFTASILI